MLYKTVPIGPGMPLTVVSDPRPPLAFRVGVTGLRHLDAAAIATLRKPVAAVLLQVREMLERSASERSMGAVYRAVLGADLLPQIRLLSPLAEGADRLVAEEALKLAMAMMLEVRGWAQLFRLKSVETG